MPYHFNTSFPSKPLIEGRNCQLLFLARSCSATWIRLHASCILQEDIPWAIDETSWCVIDESSMMTRTPAMQRGTTNQQQCWRERCVSKKGPCQTSARTVLLIVHFLLFYKNVFQNSHRFVVVGFTKDRV